MKQSAAIICLALLPASGVALSTQQNCRRTFLTDAASAAAALVLTPSIASASMLDDFGTDPSSIKQKEVEPPKAPPGSKKKDESGIEPNLRSNYYYPTNKVRYLPRIKKCSDAIPIAAENIGQSDWDAVEDFCKNIADDTILPMKLYVSSLVGGGTKVQVTFAKEMTASTKDFEVNQKLLAKAVAKKDPTKASTALEGMATALQAYRTTGNLLGADGGGDIPSVDEIRRAASRTTGRLYGKTVEARDQRVKQ